MNPAAGIACHQNPKIRGMLQRLTGRDFDMQSFEKASLRTLSLYTFAWSEGWEGRTLQIVM